MSKKDERTLGILTNYQEASAKYCKELTAGKLTKKTINNYRKSKTAVSKNKDARDFIVAAVQGKNLSLTLENSTLVENLANGGGKIIESFLDEVDNMVEKQGYTGHGLGDALVKGFDRKTKKENAKSTFKPEDSLNLYDVDMELVSNDELVNTAIKLPVRAGPLSQEDSVHMDFDVTEVNEHYALISLSEDMSEDMVLDDTAMSEETQSETTSDNLDVVDMELDDLTMSAATHSETGTALLGSGAIYTAGPIPGLNGDEFPQAHRYMNTQDALLLQS